MISDQDFRKFHYNILGADSALKGDLILSGDAITRQRFEEEIFSRAVNSNTIPLARDGSDSKSVEDTTRALKVAQGAYEVMGRRMRKVTERVSYHASRGTGVVPPPSEPIDVTAEATLAVEDDAE